ncbi:helix-turn-helix transcriptional regulator [Amycolatopsis sp. cg5]|uniref:helix-turn-helix transcriptional regulator n=1 Tax=Amycolatopsis sp. cg5 TaxID=3238802 RepID=UPI003525373E
MPSETSASVQARRLAFGQRLREVREELGMKQSDVAAAAGIDRTTYGRIEAGKHAVSIDNVFKVADALRVDVADLFTGLRDR